MSQTVPAYPSADLPTLPSRVTSRLRRLGRRVRLNGLGHRRLSEADARQLTAALLRDIDETILPRHMTVVTNTGQRFTLDVTGGRLLRLRVPGTAGALGVADDPAEAAKLLAEALGRCLINATEVTLHNERAETVHDQNDVGCSAAALAAAMGLDLDALDGESLRDKALRRLSHHAQGLLVLDADGDIVRRHGSDAVTARLEEVASEHLTALTRGLARSLSRDESSGCASFGTDAETGLHLIYALCDDTPILALLDGRRMQAMLPVLQDLFAQ